MNIMSDFLSAPIAFWGELRGDIHSPATIMHMIINDDITTYITLIMILRVRIAATLIDWYLILLIKIDSIVT